MNSTVSQFFEGINKSSISADTDGFNAITYLPGISALSSLCIGGVFVMDFKERRLPVISSRDIFLCGFSYEEAKRLGYDFFPEIVHEDDMPLLIHAHRAILNSPYIADEKSQSGIAYFYFTVRYRNYNQFYSKKQYLMICHKIKPVFINGKIRYGICMLNISVMPDSGHLKTYFNDNEKFAEYSFLDCRWEMSEIPEFPFLDERDKMILRLAKHGLNQKQIAEELCISYQRIRHIVPFLYDKLGVKNMEQAIVLASNHLKLFDRHL
ncbi:MAG: helix-turn-helix transcriptional regulator [Prevotellaceae bacterium]|jgi:DNA-binding CsgD family transcriptional regulator|nr:helix-turn-helix transcriptional regulator [Prevotellaceae bacterium]